MNRKQILVLVLVVVAMGAAYYYDRGHATPEGQPPLVSFSSDGLAPLKTAFNDSASSVRVLVMLSPT